MIPELLNAHLKEEDLSLSQYVILLNIELSPEPVGALATLAKMEVTNATAHIQRLEKRGLLKRKHDEGDRRKVEVHITKAGVEMIGRIEA